MLPIAFPNIPKDVAYLIADYVHGKPPEENVKSITNLTTNTEFDYTMLEFERESNLIAYCSTNALIPVHSIKPQE